MSRCLENLPDRPFLHLLATEHDHDPVRHLRNNGHVMRDEKDRRPGLALQAINQGQDFRLDGHVERGCRFVRNQQPGLAGQCHGDHDALPHAPGKFMRILLQPPFGLRNAHAAQELQRMLRRLLPVHPRVHAQTLCQLPPDREYRIEGRHRFLEDDANLVAANCPHEGVAGL